MGHTRRGGEKHCRIPMTTYISPCGRRNRILPGLRQRMRKSRPRRCLISSPKAKRAACAAAFCMRGHKDSGEAAQERAGLPGAACARGPALWALWRQGFALRRQRMRFIRAMCAMSRRPGCKTAPRKALGRRPKQARPPNWIHPDTHGRRILKQRRTAGGFAA